MRQPFDQGQSPVRDLSSGTSLPPPVGGWNAKDPIASMPATDAVYLDNFFPRTSDVTIRKGTAEYATVPESTALDPHNIRTLLSYSAPDGTRQLFAAADDGLYDISVTGEQLSVDSACTSASWQWINTATAGGHFLWCCNGVDKSRYYDGSAWVVLDGASTPALTGITSTDAINISLFKTRLILVEKSSLSFWYLPVVSVAGAASEYPLTSIFKRGGYLMATESWTIDAGDGADDYFVAITSEGEIAVYKGTDPSNAATWALVGVYFVGRPVGRRCFARLGGDLCVITTSGVMTLSKALLSATVDRASAITDKIQRAFTDYLSTFQTEFGWQAVLYSEGPFLLVNIPLGNRRSYQFVMNTMTKSWCRFTGMDAECWVVHGGELFYAAGNTVRKAWTGAYDLGGAIQARAKQAPNYFGQRGKVKRVALLRPIFTSGANVKAQIGLDADYNEGSFRGSALSYVQLVAYWDQSLWDAGYWSGSLTWAQWRTVAHRPGRALSLRLRINSHGSTLLWNATDFVLEGGGVLG